MNLFGQIYSNSEMADEMQCQHPESTVHMHLWRADDLQHSFTVVRRWWTMANALTGPRSVMRNASNTGYTRLACIALRCQIELRYCVGSHIQSRSFIDLDTDVLATQQYQLNRCPAIHIIRTRWWVATETADTFVCLFCRTSGIPGSNTCYSMLICGCSKTYLRKKIERDFDAILIFNHFILTYWHIDSSNKISLDH